jgi:hypothetical protein
MRHVRKLTGLAAALGVIGLGYNQIAQSADHLDSMSVTGTEAASDINDVYTWVDGNNVVLVMDVSPVATVASKFSDATKYVFHTRSGTAFGNTPSSFDIICTFNTAQNIQCWAGASTYVSGNASATAGLSSANGKFKVFAGLRADPFFFNLAGFQTATSTVKNAASLPQADAAGCRDLGATGTTLVNQLKQNAAGNAPVDFFANLNTLSIVVSIDKTLVNAGGPIMSVYAATYK